MSKSNAARIFFLLVHAALWAACSKNSPAPSGIVPRASAAMATPHMPLSFSANAGSDPTVTKVRDEYWVGFVLSSPATGVDPGIVVARMDENGNQLGTTVNLGSGSFPYAPVILQFDTHVLFVWELAGPMYMQRFDYELSPIDPHPIEILHECFNEPLAAAIGDSILAVCAPKAFMLHSDATVEREVFLPFHDETFAVDGVTCCEDMTLATNGTSYMLAGLAQTTLLPPPFPHEVGIWDTRVVAIPVAADGTAGTATVVSSQQREDPPLVGNMVWNGSEYFLVYSTAPEFGVVIGEHHGWLPVGDEIFGARIAYDGTLINRDHLQLTNAFGVQWSPVVTQVGSNYFVAFQDDSVCSPRLENGFCDWGLNYRGVGIFVRGDGRPADHQFIELSEWGAYAIENQALATTASGDVLAVTANAIRVLSDGTPPDPLRLTKITLGDGAEGDMCTTGSDCASTACVAGRCCVGDCIDTSWYPDLDAGPPWAHVDAAIDASADAQIDAGAQDGGIALADADTAHDASSTSDASTTVSDAAMASDAAIDSPDSGVPATKKSGCSIGHAPSKTPAWMFALFAMLLALGTRRR